MGGGPTVSREEHGGSSSTPLGSGRGPLATALGAVWDTLAGDVKPPAPKLTCEVAQAELAKEWERLYQGAIAPAGHDRVHDLKVPRCNT